MSYLAALFMTITMALVCIMIPRMYMDWLKIGNSLQHGEMEELQQALQMANSWVVRHFGCSMLVIAMIIWFEHDFYLAGLEQLRSALGVYALISLAFAVMESILALRISTLAMSKMTPVKVRVPKD